MAVFRIERTKDYTVMSNHHLKDKRLSLKAKGLLSQMLSLPDDWDYTLTGLTHINRESKDAIRTALQELEKCGYLHRRQTTDASGRFSSNEFIIRETPTDHPVGPSSGCPLSGNPTTGNTLTENPTQLNTYILNTNLSNTYSNPSLPSSPPPGGWMETKGSEGESRMDMESARVIIRERIGYAVLPDYGGVSQELLDEVVELLAEVVAIPRASVRISGTDYPYRMVRDRLLSLTMSHIQYILDCLEQNTTQVRNVKQYLLAVLFNAPTTMEAHLINQVQHDRYS